MTHGTMEDTLPEAGERSGRGGRGRAGLKIAAVVMVVALGAGGAYAALGGSDTDTAGTKPSSTQVDRAAADKAAADKAAADKAADTADTDAATPGKPKPAKTEKPEAALPSAKNMTTAQKRTALIAYLKDGKFPLTEDSSPATAAKGACTLLDDGMKRSKLVSELSRGAGVTEAQGEYFLVGATHFYCSKYSV